ncbi:hypothetical protein [Antrihabitans cavernicola]|uniref:Uncharacterized protein n=1 Tax=Antrihabitans cavernicola TaxID=2495913 RepID=A0A5A7SED1_9NOCA|nr:hypothetical protein [Spelaeibacter cavernicola]KAA0023759.1 hypothetical protein FOY51_03900 [Spelaeibacter cavernicola]
MSAPSDSESDSSTGLIGWIAVGCGLLAGLVLALAPVLRVVRSQEGVAANAIGTAAVVAGVAALAGPIAAAAAHAMRRSALAGGLLVGGGVLAAPMIALDIQLFRDPIDANRFELFRPETASPLTAGPGAYLVIGAHSLAVVAAILGAMTIARAALDDGYGQSAHQELSGRVVTVRAGAVASASVILVAAVWAVLQFVPAWTSTDSVIVVPLIVTSGVVTLAGTIALAVAIVAVVAGALAATSPDVAAGAIASVGVGALGIAGARFAAGIADDSLDTTTATVVATAAAAVLVIVGAAIPAIVDLRDGRDARRSTVAAAGDRAASSLALATVAKWHVAAGAAGIAASLLVGAGALLPVLAIPDGHDAPQIYATRLAIVGAAVLLVGSVFLFLSEFAAVVRPAIGPLVLAVVVAAGGVLQATVEGMRIPGVGIGAGSVAMILGVVAAAATGLLVWCAGSAERDDIDRSTEPVIDRTAVIVGAAGALAAVLALGLPLYRGTDVDAASFVLPWGFDSWAQASLGAGIVVIVAIAPRARPARALSMLTGAAIAMVVYLVGWPLTVGRADGAGVGLGVPFAVIAIGLLIAQALVIARSTKSAIPTSR